MILKIAIVLSLIYVVKVESESSKNASVIDFDGLKVISNKHNTVDIKCNHKFNLNEVRPLSITWNINNFEELSVTDCPDSSIEDLLQRLGLALAEISTVILRYDDCLVGDNIEVNENLLSTFENSLRVLNISARENCRTTVNFSPDSIKNYPKFNKLIVENSEITGMKDLNATDSLNNLLFRNVAFNEDPPFPLLKRNFLTIKILNCKIRNLTRDFFKNIPMVGYLEIENTLRKKGDVLRDLKVFSKLVLIEDRIVELPEKFIKWSPFLFKEVDLSLKSLKNISENIFSDCILGRLTIANTQLATLPENLLQESFGLIEFNLISNNLITAIPARFFEYIESLTHLNLSDNRISKIEDGTFKHLTDLVMLDLSGNKIESISRELFEGLENLEVINLSRNSIQSMSDTTFLFQINQNLRKISMASNPIGLHFSKDAWKQFESLKDLVELNLSNALITYVNLTQFSNIEFVDLSHNHIELLEIFSVLNLSNIKTVFNFENNFMICNCTAFELRKNIHKHSNLNLGPVECSFPNRLKGQKFIEIDLNEFVCQSSVCSKNCNCFVRPADESFLINCSSLQLTSVPKTPPIDLGQFTNVELIIENNLIKELPMADRNFSQINKIFARNNLIEKLYTAGEKLKSLDVRHNKLIEIDKETWESFQHQTVSLNLSENPWHCDCSTVDFFSFVLHSHQLIEDFYEMRCDGTGVTFISTQTFDICLKAKLIATICVSAIIGIIGLVIYYKYHNIIRIYLFSRGCSCVKEQDVDGDKIYDAFIIFTEHDLCFVEKIVEGLEKGEKPFKCCVHFRDFRAGEFVTDQIHNAINSSRRIIVFVSEHFKDSNWVCDEIYLPNSWSTSFCFRHNMNLKLRNRSQSTRDKTTIE